MLIAWFKDAHEGMLQPCVHNVLGLVDGKRKFKHSGIGGDSQKGPNCYPGQSNQLRAGQTVFQPGSTRFMLDGLRVVGVEQ